MSSPFTDPPAGVAWKPSRRSVVFGTLAAAGGLVRVVPAGAGEAAGPAPLAEHAIAMHGQPAWGPDFSHPTYANPAAPKGGTLVQGVLGTFDSLNPFIVQGLPAISIRSYVIESLLARGYAEPFTLYGLLADSVETDTARSYVTFSINPAARFSDGKPVTAEDVIFSWRLLRDHGRPNFGIYYSKVVKAESDGRKVRFDLADSKDRELPLILGLMPIVAKHATDPDGLREDELHRAARHRPLHGDQGETGRQRHLHPRSELLGP